MSTAHLRAAHPWWAIAVHVESLPDLWVGGAWPLAIPDGFADVRPILALHELAPTSGSGDPFTGLGSPARVRLRCHDATGYLRTLLSSGTQAILTEPFLAADDTVTVDDASGFDAAGLVWVHRELYEYTSRTDTVFTLASADPLFTLRAKQELRTPAAGPLPPYRVGATPYWIDGRIVRIYAIPTTRDGGALATWDERLEIWRGVITAVPYSLSGVDYIIECDGLERLVQAPSISTTAEVRLPGALPLGEQEVLVTEATNQLHIAVEAAISYTYTLTIPTGVLTPSGWRDIMESVGAILSATPYYPQEWRLGTSIVIPVPDAATWLSAKIIDGPRSVAPQLGLAAGDIIAYPSVWALFYTGDELEEILGWFHVVLQPRGALQPVLIPANSTVIPVLTPFGIDWSDVSHVQVKDSPEVCGLISYSQSGYQTSDGRALWHLEVTRGVAGAPQTYASDGRTEGPPVHPGLQLASIGGGAAVADIMEQLRTLGPDFIEVGMGIVDQAGPTGIIGSMLPATASASDALSDLAALDGCTIAPGMCDDGTYRLRVTKIGNLSNAYRLVEIDWDEAVHTRSGLGQSVTTIITRLKDGSQVTTHYLPSLLAVGIQQARQYTGYIAPSAASLTQLGAAAQTLLAKFGRPGIVLDCSVGPQYRDLRVGDSVRLTLPDGAPRDWFVMETQPSWVGPQPATQVRLYQAHLWDTVWYAPAALVTDESGAAIEVAAADPYLPDPPYPTQSASRWQGMWFRPGEQVVFVDLMDNTALQGPYTIDKINMDTNTVTLTGAPTSPVTGMWMIHYSYDTAGTGQGLYAWVADEGERIHEWGG